MNFDKFHVLSVISNPIQYQSRYRLYKLFAEELLRQGAQLWTVELQTGSRPHKVTESDNIRHIQVWSSSLCGELWHKESLTNLGINHIIKLVPDLRYLMWSDADFKFEPDALEKVYHALQHYDVVQAWSHLINLGPDGSTTGDFVSKSFMFCHVNGIVGTNKSRFQQGIGAPGGAWAARRDALNKMGCAIASPLIDWGILGSGDRYFACALIGKMEWCVDPRLSPGYKRWLYIYQDNVVRSLKQNVGYVPNTVRHMFHGSVADRGYETRTEILVKWQFDPDTDLAKDVSGVWRLIVETDRQIGLRNDLRKYFRSRQEDSNSVHRSSENRETLRSQPDPHRHHHHHHSPKSS